MPVMRDRLSTSRDPYTQSLQSAFSAIQGSGMFSGPTDASFEMRRVSPEEEQAAYQTGYANLPRDISNYWAPTQEAGFGEVPESRLSGYFDLTQPYLFGQGMEQINAQLAEAGFAPSGTGGIGPQAELAGRLQAQLAVPRAQALIGNATRGSQARTQGAFGRAQALTGAAGDIGSSRYRALTTPNITRISGKGANSGFGGIFPTQRATWPEGWDSFSASRGSASPGGGGGMGGGGGSTGGTPWWQTSYGEMNQGAGAAWNALHPAGQLPEGARTTEYGNILYNSPDGRPVYRTRAEAMASGNPRAIAQTL